MGKTVVVKRVGKKAVLAPVVEKKKRPVPTKPSLCPGYVRGRLTDAIETIADGFVKQAEKGSCQHLKLASELLEKGQPKPREKKGSAERFLDKLQGKDRDVARRNERGRGEAGKFLKAGVRD